MNAAGSTVSLLTSEDLLIGYRFDIGLMPGPSSPYEWRTLVARDIDYGTPARYHQNVKSAIDTLMPPRRLEDND